MRKSFLTLFLLSRSAFAAKQGASVEMLFRELGFNTLRKKVTCFFDERQPEYLRSADAADNAFAWQAGCRFEPLMLH